MEQWRPRAACLGEPVALFYPDHGSRSAAAIQVCSRCFVRQECLRYALAKPEVFGIWGGLTPQGRTALKNRVRKQRKDGTENCGGEGDQCQPHAPGCGAREGEGVPAMAGER